VNASGGSARLAPRVWAPSISIGLPALAVTAVTLIAAALRFHSLEGVPPNPFYDAAVRSMAHSWHNFFFAAFEPGGRVAVDKPPVDLWLQVASVKLLGFDSLALKLPEALAGTASVPLLYDLVRRVFGRGAGLASALALAVLPATVLTSRSDTMDTVMMLCVIAAAWLVVRSAQTGRTRFLYLAAAVMGVAFNVKLVEALLPLPALTVLYLLASSAPRRRRAAHVLLATLVFAAFALSWVTVVSLWPASSKPYPLGSTDGSTWSSTFVFDGVDRLGFTSRHPGPAGVAATPSFTRLVKRAPPPLGRWLGSELVPALVLGCLAAALGGLTARARAPDERLRRALAAALALWLLFGIAAFSHVAQLHVRYLEALTPAIAAALGIGLALARRSLLLAGGVVAVGVYALYLAKGTPPLEAIVIVGALGALLAIAVRAAPPLVSAMVLVLALAVPAWASVGVASHHKTDAATGGRLSPSQVALLDRYLAAHTRGARYEVATLNVWEAAPLVSDAGRPVLVIRNVNFRPLVSPSTLRQTVRAGDLRYVLLGHECGGSARRRHYLHNCPPAARWTRAHGREILVSGRRLGLYRVHG
jgi:4-amino-4-deoxy-L-arabinose transferase-like glycosyltransferase